MTTTEEAATIIKNGGVVAFPTETVYGIGADATSQSACLSIYKAKERPGHNPLIVHVNSIEQVKVYAEFNNNAQKLSKFWPGPLTMVLKKVQNSGLADCVTAGLDTVAIRIPAYTIAKNLIKQSECPIAAPSANKSGRLSPTSYDHVYDDFRDSIAIIKDKRSSTYGLESTIIDLSTDTPTILRLGFITPEILEESLGEKVKIASKLSKVKAPGMLLKHYAPRTKLRLNASTLLEGEIGLNFAGSSLVSEASLNLSISGDLAEAAANLFNYLHQLDKYAVKHKIKSIAVAPIPNKSIGLAINDRLSRAAEGS
ncbi:MAG: L-threonylcarbamoyladenylate synthase [Rickettsiaceae bacterium]|nr:L-threonylcarbamoyladenylate synthase [Rickettsiaceae bacterium]